VITHVNLLLFSAKNLVFGACAKQVEGVLEPGTCSVVQNDDTGYTITYQHQKLRLVDFSTQIQYRTQVNNEGDIASTQKDLPEETCGSEHADFSPSFFLPSSKILIVKHREEGYLGVYIENLEKLATVSLEHIYALPILMQKKKRLSGLWGLARLDERLIILIDLEQL